MKEHCSMTNNIKGVVNKAFKDMVSKEVINLSDMLESQSASFEAIAYISELLDASYEMLDDCYNFMNEQTKINEILIKENEELKRMIQDQTDLINEYISDLRKCEKKYYSENADMAKDFKI